MDYYSSYKLNIPELWEKDWEGAISNADGVGKEILKFQFKLAQLLKNINDFSLTPERLAWITLWTRVFSSLEAALLSINSNCIYNLKIISRAIFEDSLHFQMIIEQKQNNNNTQSKLCAYVAWCLWKDKKVIKDILNNLDDIWSSSFVNKIASDPENHEAYEKIFGKLNLQSEQELIWQKNYHKKMAEEKLLQIENWMEHIKISPWIEKIESHRIKSFYSLLDKESQNVYQRLKDYGIGFGYATFMESSSILHGSTIEQFIFRNKSHITPKFTGFPEETDSVTKYICESCSSSILVLYFIHKQLWSINV